MVMVSRYLPVAVTATHLQPVRRPGSMPMTGFSPYGAASRRLRPPVGKECIQQVEHAVKDGKITESAAQNIHDWLTERKYRKYAAQVAEHIAQGKWKDLDDVFWTIIPFGTGGRRGRMYPSTAVHRPNASALRGRRPADADECRWPERPVRRPARRPRSHSHTTYRSG